MTLTTITVILTLVILGPPKLLHQKENLTDKGGIKMTKGQKEGRDLI